MEPVSLPHNLSWVSGQETLVIIYIYGTVYLTIISIVAAESVSWVCGIRLPVMGEWNILVAHIQSYSRHPRGVIIFLTLYVGGWVGRLLMAGTPEGLLSLASYTVTFEWLPSVMKIFQPWKHLTHMHCESHGDSLFLLLAHIWSWEDVVDHTTQLLRTICLLRHLMSLSYMPSVVWSIISSWHCMWVGEWAGYLWQAPQRGYFLWHHIQ